MTIYRLDVLLSQFGTSLLFHDQFCHFLTCIQVSQEAGIPISLRIFQFVVIHTVKGFGIVNEAEVGVSLESLCSVYDSRDGGNLTD